jgi:hypothetical protein
MRRRYYLKIPILIFILIFLSIVSTPAQEDKDISEKDTTKAVEIRIGDEGIYIRTETGEEYRYKKGEIPDIKTTITISPGEEERITFRKKLLVSPVIIKNDIVKAGTDIVVEEDELVKGDVTGLGADVTIRGKVDGSVVAVGGDIIVTSTGEIEEDATSVGGDVRKEAGGVIGGEVVEVGFVPREMLRMPFRTTVPRGFPFMFIFFKVLFLLFIGLVVFSVVPDHVNRVKVKLEKEMLKSGLVGFLGEILILPIFILLIITVIGIPVAILVEPLLILLAVLLGYTAVSLYIGEKFKENTNIKPKTPLMTVLLGIIVVELIPIFARIIGVAGEPGSAVGLVFVIIYWALIYLILTIGFGAVILTRFGVRPKEAKVAPEQKESNDTTPA